MLREVKDCSVTVWKIANELRRIVREETGLTISVGCHFARCSQSLAVTIKPDATTVFSKSNWKQFIYPLSVKRFAFCRKKTVDELERLGVKTIGQLAKYDEHILVRHFGKAGNMLYRYANGLDSEPVKSIYEKEKVKSVGNGMTFRQDLVGEEDVRAVYMHFRTVLRHVYAENMKCTTVQILIKIRNLRV